MYYGYMRSAFFAPRIHRFSSSLSPGDACNIISIPKCILNFVVFLLYQSVHLLMVKRTEARGKQRHNAAVVNKVKQSRGYIPISSVKTLRFCS